MKRFFIACLLLGAPMVLPGHGRLAAQSAPDTPPATGNDSAYVALRVMAKTLGKDSLERVVEVAGHDGKPQPYLWKIVLQDGPGGTREVDVADGKIASQRTIATPPAARDVIHLADLNLDSSGAFDATDAQARKVHLRFDSVNYLLRASESTAKPQWTLSLYNQEGADVGAMCLAANDGNIVSIDGKLGSNPSAPAASTPRPPAIVSTVRTDSTPAAVRPRATLRATESHTTTTTTTTIVGNPPLPAPPPPPPYATTETTVVDEAPADRGEGGLFTRTGRTLDKTGHTVGDTLDKTGHTVTDTLDKTGHTVTDTLRRTGTTLQRFFTGHGGDSDPQPTPVPVRDPNYRGD